MVGLPLMMINSSCKQSTQDSIQTEWLGENRQEIADNLEQQLQGFSRTMVETSYRYHELYWAGMDKNWDFAEYQREHIMEALEQGFIRRPEHEPSAQAFVNVALPEIQSAVESQNSEMFEDTFLKLTNACNTCHQMEDVPFITIVIPSERNTVVYY